MNFGLDINLHVGLEQKLSPQMIQSLKLLQMNSLELEVIVKQELEGNPLLETVEEIEVVEEEEENAISNSDGKDETDQKTAESDDAREEKEAQEELNIPEGHEKSTEIDWETYLEDGFDHGDKRTEELESPDERFERVPVYSRTLQDHLMSQLQDRHMSAEVREVVEYLINSLDEGGYLAAEGPPVVRDPLDPSGPPGEKKASGDGFGENLPEFREVQAVIEGRLNLINASNTVREAFHILHGMEPPGIGARNLRECLILQINRRRGISDIARRIVEQEFELLEKLKISAIAKKFDLTGEQIQTALREIGTLEPRPGRLLSQSTANAITPDLIVEEVEGDLVLMLNDRSTPSLRISRAYAGLLKKGSKASAEEKKFVREKLNSATWLIRAIEQRKSTMLKVMQAIIESQPDFFKKGPTNLRPLILQDIADKISMHISTVSRVTSGKYVQTSHGIFELKYFFTAGVTQADGSEVSSVTAKEEIKKLIESEDTHKPLSDQRIVEILKGKNLDVARRTVAKYRDQLEILPARLRKQY